MKTKFFCVNVEFYDYGKVLACVTSNGRRGKSQYRQVSGMAAFKIWFVGEATANQLLEDIKSGTVDIDDLLAFWSDFQDYENKVWNKGVAA